jgi:CRISPR-associated protein Cas5t
VITLRVEVPYASFRKSFARSFAETYPLPPPATIYGMLLSLVGERFRRRHEGVRLAFAFKRVPQVATTLRKLSRYKYGVASKQSKLGNAPDFIETLCGIEFLCWVESSQEKQATEKPTLEQRLTEAIASPTDITRYGVLCLGLSDDAVNDVSICQKAEGKWHRLLPQDSGSLELPVWVDHVGSAKTRWQRYHLEAEADLITVNLGDANWRWTEITAPTEE